MIAGKHLDPLVGVNGHIVQPPGPVPPVPIDPMDYLPILEATVKINGLLRAVAGTRGQAMRRNIPMGDVFVKPPTSESEVRGSMTVSADGDPLSRMAMPVLSCQDIGMPAPPRKRKKKEALSLMLPTTLLMAIPVRPMVMVGGLPMIAMPGPMDALGPSKGWADEVPHAHKETVRTAHVTDGNYPSKSATTFNDSNQPTSTPSATHIPILW